MILRDMSPALRGEVTLFAQHGDGTLTTLGQGRNKIVRQGMSVLSSAIAGDIEINGMYMAYTNGAVSTTDTEYTDTASSVVAAWSNSTDGVVRVPLIANPSFSTSDGAKYTQNQAIFTALSDTTPVVPGAGNAVTDSTSKFYAAGLIYRHPDGYADDLLFSVINFDDITLTPDDSITKLANVRIGMHWTITMDTTEV